MICRRHLIGGASCLAVALGLAMALLTTKSEAQPLGPSLSQMQPQAQVPLYEKAQVRRGPHRGPPRRRDGAGVRDLAFTLALVPGVMLVGSTRPPMPLVVAARRSRSRDGQT
jgi:hypothetical protein